jgi:hypothetical protein
MKTIITYLLLVGLVVVIFSVFLFGSGGMIDTSDDSHQHVHDYLARKNVPDGR